MMLRPLGAAAAVLAVALGVTALVHRGGDERTVAGESAPPPQLWTGTATLLQTPNGKLTLCGGTMLLSLPPAGCGGALVRDLDPMTVPGAHRFENGTITTPSVRLVGAWDGEALTPTRPPEVAEPARPSPAPDIPRPGCPEPAGGWPYDKADQSGWQRVQEYVATQPDAGTPRVDKSQRIFTVPFTGGLDRHRADIAKLYDGPLCVERTEHSDRELRAVFERVRNDLRSRGVQLLSGNSGGSPWPYDEVSVVAMSPSEMKEMEASYDGMLRLSSFLVPAD